MYGNQIVKSKNIWFSSWLGCDMYILKNSSVVFGYQLNPAYPISDALTKKLRSDPQSFFNTVQEHDIIFGLSSIRETDNFLIFTSNRRGLFFIEKTTSAVYRETTISDENTGLYLPNYFPYDGDDGRIMFIVSPNDWLHRRPVAIPDNIPAHLREQFESLKVKEDDNPLLVFYKEKNGKT
jgi:hypothetical protein